MNNPLTDGVNMKRDPQAILADAGFVDVMASDPLTIALEGAVHAVHNGYGEVVTGIPYSAAQSLPPNSTDFERGMAAGMAVMLMASIG